MALAWRSVDNRSAEPSILSNPLQLRAAIEMAVLFQLALVAVFYVREWLGDPGMLPAGFLLGLTDVDALTLSMTRGALNRSDIDVACRAIALGIVANSLLKAAIAVAVGKGAFKWLAGASLTAMATTGAAAFAF
jgi:uncharacterized membrane protein (DUF4010 family)